MGIDPGFAKPPAEGFAPDCLSDPLAAEAYPYAAARQLAIDVGNDGAVGAAYETDELRLILDLACHDAHAFRQSFICLHRSSATDAYPFQFPSPLWGRVRGEGREISHS